MPAVQDGKKYSIMVFDIAFSKRNDFLHDCLLPLLVQESKIWYLSRIHIHELWQNLNENLRSALSKQGFSGPFCNFDSLCFPVHWREATSTMVGAWCPIVTRIDQAKLLQSLPNPGSASIPTHFCSLPRTWPSSELGLQPSPWIWTTHFSTDRVRLSSRYHQHRNDSLKGHMLFFAVFFHVTKGVPHSSLRSCPTTLSEPFRMTVIMPHC